MSWLLLSKSCVKSWCCSDTRTATEPCDSGFHFTACSLGVWIGAGYFLCPWSVYLLSLKSFPIFYRLETETTRSNVWFGWTLETAYTVQEWPLPRCCCQAQRAGSLWPLRAQAVRAILEIQEPSSSWPVPEAIPMFQDAILHQDLQPPLV